jgi:hypothetical protein
MKSCQSLEVTFSPNSLSEDFYIPRPLSARRVSSSPIKRRSGIRLAANLSSDSLSVNIKSCQRFEVTLSPKSHSEDFHIPRPPSVRRVSSSPIKRRSGVRLTNTSSISLGVQNTSRPTPPKAANVFLSRSSSDEVFSQSSESIEDAPAVADIAECISSNSDTITDEEPTVIESTDAPTNKEAMNRHFNGLLVSSATNDASKPSTSAVTAVQELPAHDNDGIPISKLDLEIDKSASFLAIQAIEEALLEEVTEMFDAKSKKDDELPVAKPALFASQAGEDVSICNSFTKLTEHAPNIATVKSSSDGQSIAKVTKIISAEATETAVLDVDTEQTEITANIPGAKLVNDGYNEPDNIVAKPTAKTNEVTEIPSVKSSTEDQVTESQGSNQKLIVRGKALTITKVSVYQCIYSKLVKSLRKEI